MSPDNAGARLVPGDQPDRVKWNARYAAGFAPSFTPHPLATRSLTLDLPAGPGWERRRIRRSGFRDRAVARALLGAWLTHMKV